LRLSRWVLIWILIVGVLVAIEVGVVTGRLTPGDLIGSFFILQGLNTGVTQLITGNVLVTGAATPAYSSLRTQDSALSTPSGMIQIPLKMLADLRITEGPAMIKSENGRLRNYVTLNVRDRDLVGFVEEAKEALKPIETQLAGTGMSVEWSGDFEHQMRTNQTMALILPMVFALIFFLLFLTFHDVLDTLLVILAVAGALCGAILFQAFFGFNFSVIVWIGYIAAFGMATQTGVIMLVYLRESLAKHGGLEKIPSLAVLKEAVIRGAVHRLRPRSGWPYRSRDDDARRVAPCDGQRLVYCRRDRDR